MEDTSAIIDPRNERKINDVFTGNRWFMDNSAFRLRKSKQLLDEADKSGAVPTHFKQKTGLVEINLRAIVQKPEPAAAAAAGAPVAAGKAKPEPPETASVLKRPVRPAPAPTDREGRIVPGSQEDSSSAPEPDGEPAPDGEVAE